MCACNNLAQYGIQFSLTTLHTVDPTSAELQTNDLRNFVATCRMCKGLQARARGRARRAAAGLQHRALQREAA